MPMLRWLLSGCFGLLWVAHASGQTRITVSGTVTDATTGETLIGAQVYGLGTQSGMLTNGYGFFNLQVPSDCPGVSVQYIGYQTDTIEVSGTSRTGLSVSLQPYTIMTEAAVIEAEGSAPEERAEKLGTLELRPEEARSIPQLFGERDVIKAIQLMPGVQATSDGGSGFFVRGGGADQNLILLDEAPVYNPSHLLGFFSVFNGDALNTAELYKSGIPARFGGRASSVLDIRMKDGNAGKTTVSGGIGLISSRLTIETPLADGRGSALISGRRTYGDLFLNFSADTNLQNTALYFYDLNAKVNYRINDRNRLYLSLYNGRDDFDFAEAFLLRWGNRTATLRWNFLLSDEIFLNTSVVWSDYAYRVGFGPEDTGFFRDAGIQDVQIKEDFTWYAHPSHTVRFGGQWIQHTFSDVVSIDSEPAPDRAGWETALYLEDEWSFAPRWKAVAGLRAARFDLVRGPVYALNAEGELMGDPGEAADAGFGTGGLEPRLSVQGAVGKRHALKFSAERNRQFLHLVSSSAAGNPTDLWLPVSNNVAPLVADQFAGGWSTNTEDGMWSLSAEVYYKRMLDLLEFKVGADVFAPTTLETELVSGDGEAYGIEWLVRKERGDFTGWVSYTLSRSFRTFDAIDDGLVFPAASDRIHDISLVAMWQVSPRVSASANWVYHTGDPATFPTGWYLYETQLVPQYSRRNQGRFPHYHRLDLGITLKSKDGVARSGGGKTGWQAFRGGEWTFSCYNAYGRENTYLINFEPSEEDPAQTQAVSLALFKVIPSISYDFKF